MSNSEPPACHRLPAFVMLMLSATTGHTTQTHIARAPPCHRQVADCILKRPLGAEVETTLHSSYPINGRIRTKVVAV